MSSSCAAAYNSYHSHIDSGLMTMTRLQQIQISVLAIVILWVIWTLSRCRTLLVVITTTQAHQSHSHQVQARRPGRDFGANQGFDKMEEQQIHATQMQEKMTTMMKPRLEYHSMAKNYTPDQGFDPVAPIVMDEQSVYRHLEYYALSRSQPIIYFITPTYKRPTQMVDLLRVSQALQMDDLGIIYWIVVEDAPNCTKRVRDLIDRVGLPYAHLAISTKKEIRKRGNKNKKPHRGVDQRNLALDWVETISETLPGVVYFGDDDNAYDGEQ